jgi:NTP pyrophosphatase (non-canonical NTP hydrolase)
VELSALTRRALVVRERYEAFERETYGRPWSLGELTLGLVGDVGDLAKVVQAHEGVRHMDDARHALEHELADVLWSLLVIAHICEIDLEAAFPRAMDELERSLAGLGD